MFSALRPRQHHPESRLLSGVSENCLAAVLLISLQCRHQQNKDTSAAAFEGVLPGMLSPLEFFVYDSFRSPDQSCSVQESKSMWQFTLEVNFYLSGGAVVVTSRTPATVTRCTCVFNDAITSAASAMSDGVIFKDIRCVCFFLSRTSYTNSSTNPCCSCCGKDVILLVMDPQNAELQGSAW